jgi:hypothetical protein
MIGEQQNQRPLPNLQRGMLLAEHASTLLPLLMR